MSVTESTRRVLGSGTSSRFAACGITLGLLRLCRPSHWTKNLLILLPLGVAVRRSIPGLAPVAWSVLEFILASSIVYVANDIADRQRDRAHPVKRSRPIAAGQVPVGIGAVFVLVLSAAFTATIVSGPAPRYWPVVVYLALNAAYTFGLKHIPLVEVGVVATGYVLRVGQGFLAIQHTPDSWLLISVFCCCAVLVLGKRRHELLVAGTGHRTALRGYSVDLLDRLLQLACALAMVSGLLYLQGSPLFGHGGHGGQAATLISVPLAFFAIARYLQLVVMRGGGGDPVRALLRDPVLVATSLLWVAALAAAEILT